MHGEKKASRPKGGKGGASGWAALEQLRPPRGDTVRLQVFWRSGYSIRIAWRCDWVCLLAGWAVEVRHWGWGVEGSGRLTGLCICLVWETLGDGRVAVTTRDERSAVRVFEGRR